MDIITAILILLGSSIIAGTIFEKFGLPDVAGQILSGVILGPAVIGLIQPSSSLFSISDIALFFLVLLLGLEVTSKALTTNPMKNIALSLSSFVFPVTIMFVISYLLLGFEMVPAVILSVGIGVPSISIVSVLLRHYSLVGTEDGNKIMTSVVISDILAFIALAAVYNAHDIYHLLLLIITIIIFISLLLMAARLLRNYHRHVIDFFSSLASGKYGETSVFAIVILLGLVIASFLQFIGISFVLGAFFAGMLLEEFVMGKGVFRTLVRTFRRINGSFFIPLFFSIAGATTMVPNLSYIAILIILIVVSAASSAGFTSYIGKKAFKKLQPLSAMSILGGRGAIGIIIGNIAFLAGLINIQLYSVIVLGTVVMAVFFSAFIRPKFKHSKRRR